MVFLQILPLSAHSGCVPARVALEIEGNLFTFSNHDHEDLVSTDRADCGQVIQKGVKQILHF